MFSVPSVLNTLAPGQGRAGSGRGRGRAAELAETEKRQRMRRPALRSLARRRRQVDLQVVLVEGLDGQARLARERAYEARLQDV